MAKYVIYLRKSRMDLEAESHGEGETLARHEKILLELAKKMKINIKEIYKEVVSGETIAARPIMQKLLTEVEQGKWNGVLVMEVERLARGDTIDQGLVAQAFKYSNTVIITPNKTYNPDNEFDEEYFEFGLFMSRREYKTINRRLQRGRLQSVKEGKYLGSIAPYGYKRVPLDNQKGFTLEFDENEASVVRLIYDLYVNGEDDKDFGSSLITHRLNKLLVPTRSGLPWSFNTINDILKNPVYAGFIRWDNRKTVKKVVEGEVIISRPINEDNTLVKGLHPAIIDVELFDKAQNKRRANRQAPIPDRHIIKNPLAGLVYCSYCKKIMQRRPYSTRNEESLICKTPDCKCVSSFLHMVEYRLIEVLVDWLEEFKIQIKQEEENTPTQQDDIINTSMVKLNEELDLLNTQLNNLYDLLEQGVYSLEVFNERLKNINDRIAKNKSDKDSLKALMEEKVSLEEKKAFIPKVEHVIRVYATLDNAKEKNNLLKSILDKIEYTKKEGGRHSGVLDNFTLSILPKF